MSDLKLTVTSWGKVVLDKKELRAVMRAAGNDVRGKTARLIAQQTGGGRAYSNSGGTKYGRTYRPARYTASAPGDPPVRVSGALHKSLKTYVYKSAEGFAVRARQFYALFLESGARGGGNPHRKGAGPGGRRHRARGRYTVRVLLPRPFLDRVMAQEAPTLNRRVGKALVEGLRWKDTK